MTRIRIRDARVVVTGAGSGIGRATALLCAQAGASVVSVDIDSQTAQETAAACAEHGVPVVARTCDVADAEAVRELAEETEAQDGPVDVLVNNAGVGVGGPFLEASIEDWDWLMGINLDGVAYGCHAFGQRMAGRGRGHIVNVASGAAYVMNRDMAAYCASKAAVVALSRCLRADLAGVGVGVSAICPGVVNTPIASNTRMFGALAERQERIAGAFRFGHAPELVARAIVGAVERNQAVVPVGLEAAVLYRVLPFLPSRIHGALVRSQLARIL